MRPKPMVEIGGRPILWHIMKTYAHHGVNDFIICCGYKGYVIKEYFANYFLHMSDVTFDFSDGSMQVHNKKAESWKVTLVDTGEQTQTGGRIKRIRDYIEDDLFCMTYGDGLADVDIAELIRFHRSQNVLAVNQGLSQFGTPYSWLSFLGVPLRRVDAIVNTEAQVS